MANKKLAPNETNVNTIINKEAWKNLGIAAAFEDDTKRNVLEKAIKLYLETHHADLVGFKRERTWQDGPDTNHPFDFSEME
jgi:hypothetical protein